MPSAAITEQLTRALGEARIWSDLPQDVQDRLFKEAVASRGESIRSQLAVFLHDNHERTSDPLGDPREMKEPAAFVVIGFVLRLWHTYGEAAPKVIETKYYIKLWFFPGPDATLLMNQVRANING
jgi:hypothetical protein